VNVSEFGYFLGVHGVSQSGRMREDPDRWSAFRCSCS
jgi:hypothetical protein